jgi:glycosyltransferase involved in cell wall biosynthesis
MSSYTPSVTVGISFYNSEATLLDAVRSVFAQTHTDWVLLLIDDGSSDSSLRIARSFRDPRVRVLADGKHRGVVSRYNQIVQDSTTHYVAHMGADDLMHPLRLEMQMRYLSRHPEIDALGSWAFVIDEKDAVIGVRRAGPHPLSAAAVLRRGFFIHPTVVASREWLLKNPYDGDYLRSEDYELWCRTYEQSRFRNLEAPLLFYREGELSLGPKYALSCRTNRRIFAKYGPATLGLIGTKLEIAKSWAKEIVCGVSYKTPSSSALVRLRNDRATEAEITEAFRALRTIHSVEIPQVVAA